MNKLINMEMNNEYWSCFHFSHICASSVHGSQLDYVNAHLLSTKHTKSSQLCVLLDTSHAKQTNDSITIETIYMENNIQGAAKKVAP